MFPLLCHFVHQQKWQNIWYDDISTATETVLQLHIQCNVLVAFLFMAAAEWVVLPHKLDAVFWRNFFLIQFLLFVLSSYFLCLKKLLRFLLLLLFNA